MNITKIKTILITGALGLSGISSTFASTGRVLVVLSGVDYVSVRNAAPHPTGYFLPELTGPLSAIKRAGYEVVYANPNGKAPAMDKVSDDPKWFKSPEEYQNAKKLLQDEKAFSAPRLLRSLNEKELATFDAVFLPGGHAPMEDLYKDQELGRILRHFNKYKKPTALICHAPIALLAAKTEKNWIYSDYKMTVFSNAEEIIEEDAGVFGGHLNYYVQNALSLAGGLVSVGVEWTSNAVRDRELITGQNPMSEEAFTKLLMEALIERKLEGKKIIKLNDLDTTELPPNKLLNVMDQNQPDWTQGYSTLYIGKRKNAVAQVDFIAGMTGHVELVKSAFSRRGLRGYVVFFNGDIEFAYQNWTSKASAEAAFSSDSAKAVFEDASRLMNNAHFGQIEIPPNFISGK